MPVAAANGLDLFYEESGSRSDPTLLLICGLGAQCTRYDEDLVQGFVDLGLHVVRYDNRDAGLSTHLPVDAAYSLSDMAADGMALLDALGIDSAHLWGSSMGGMIAQVMVLDRPEHIERLILMDTHHGRLGTIDGELVKIGIELARTEGLAVIQEVLKMGADPLDNPAYRRVCAERPGYEEWSESKMLRSSPAMYAAMLGYLDSVDDRLDELASVDQQTLVLVGELDEGFRRASERMAAAIPHAELVVLEGGGHSPQFEATQAWREAVDSFLAVPG